MLLLRAEREGTAALVGGFARTVEAAYLVRTGWARQLAAPRATAARPGHGSSVAGASDAALARDPHALVARFPARGPPAGPRRASRPARCSCRPRGRATSPSLACDRCRTPARCGVCTGPLALGGPHPAPGLPVVRHGGPRLVVRHCGGHGLRAPVLGDARTAEELGRAFPGRAGPLLLR